ncbi:MAG: Crp/Fnr family transcriptional regulator [Gammaproteobacteria bacterium]
MKNRRVENGLLAALSPITYRDLLVYLEPVNIEVSAILYRPEETTQYVYFPRSGIVSLLATVEGSNTLEVAMVGNEGLIGIPVFLGVAIPYNLAVVRTAGMAMRMHARAFYEYSRRDETLQRLLDRYTHALLTEVSQLSVCHRFHTIDMRFACWLMTTQDRLQSDGFTITQHVIAQRLGVRRASISLVAQAMQRRNLIRYLRGNITIINRPGLEALSCSCYNVIATQTRYP